MPVSDDLASCLKHVVNLANVTIMAYITKIAAVENQMAIWEYDSDLLEQTPPAHVSSEGGVVVGSNHPPSCQNARRRDGGGCMRRDNPSLSSSVVVYQ